MYSIEPRSEGCKEWRTFYLVPIHELGNCTKNIRGTYSKKNDKKFVLSYVFFDVSCMESGCDWCLLVGLKIQRTWFDSKTFHLWSGDEISIKSIARDEPLNSSG